MAKLIQISLKKIIGLIILTTFANNSLHSSINNAKISFSEEYYMSSEGIYTYCMNIFLNSNDTVLSNNLENSNLLNHNCKQFDLKIYGFESSNNLEMYIENYLLKNIYSNDKVEVLHIYFLDAMQQSLINFNGAIFTSFKNLREIKLIGDSNMYFIKLLEASNQPLNKLEYLTMENVIFCNDYLPNYLKPKSGFRILDLSFEGKSTFYINVVLNEKACFTIRVKYPENLNLVISEGQKVIPGNDVNYESIKVFGNNLKNINLIFEADQNRFINVTTLLLYNEGRYLKNVKIDHPANFLIEIFFANIQKRKMPKFECLYKHEIKNKSNLHDRAYTQCWF